eukprot:s866_g16.t6
MFVAKVWSSAGGRLALFLVRLTGLAVTGTRGCLQGQAAVDIAAGRGVQDDVFRADFRFDRLAQKIRLGTKSKSLLASCLTTSKSTFTMSAARLLLAILAVATGKRIYTREQDAERVSLDTLRSLVKGLQGFPEEGLQAMLEEVPIDRDGLMRSSAVLRFLQDRGVKDQARRKERLAAMEKSFVASLEAQAKDLFQKLRQDEGVQESLPTTTTTTTSLLAMAVKEAASKDVGALAAHRAAIHNRAATLRFLHEVGVSINATDKFGQTPALSEAGADMEAADDAGDTPLHAAAFYCEVEAVRFLIQAGVNKTAVNKNGKTPADINACAYEQEVELLLQEEAGQSLQPAVTNTTSLQPAATSLQPAATTISVREAAWKGNVSALAAHLKAGADLGAKLPGAFGTLTPAQIAAIYNHSSVLRFLHEVGVDLNVATDDFNASTPAHLAAAKGYVNVLQALHEAGANMEATDRGGNTPLHLAAMNGYVDAVRFLIQAGANQSAVNFLGMTPADYAFRNGRQEAKVGVNVNARDRGGRSPAHSAAAVGNLDVLEVLREAGADMEAANDRGETPLHVAVLNCKVDAVRFLIQAGVNKTAVNKEGRTPVDMNACWNPEVALLLQAQLTTTTAASWGSTSGYFEAYDGMTTGMFEAYDGMTTGKFEAYDGMTTGKFEALARERGREP